jgi:hypothetical protein
LETLGASKDTKDAQAIENPYTPLAQKFVNAEHRKDIDWGMKFAVNEAIDFQTDQKIKTKIKS